ncbi:MAG: HAD-IC family P-type ATPase, partial [Firmicutes bacterium]|nr:HAD-IC family P-type ATPase [Bacillota bacterium]
MSSTPWHALPVEQVAEKLGTSLQQGLSREEAERRLAQYGPNELEQMGRKTFLRMFIEQFADFMVIILIIAAVISALLGEFKDAVIIMMIVLLNGLLGAIQENKAEESLAALKKMAAPHAKVLREGRIDVVPAARLVPGDIVVLETGDFVPADIRLSEITNLKIEEAALTGESVPVEKNSQTLDNTEIPLGDRLNMAHTSSLVTYGRGRGIVVETGMATQIGKIAALIQSEEGTKTPLQKRMEVLGKTLGIAALAVCAVIFIVGVLYGKELFEMFLTAVSLAVAAIPEGLPAIVTIVLAIGVQRMSRRNAIIRKLPSVETLGSATVICSDKTGTLTQNKMSVEKVYFGGRLLEAGELKEAGGEAWKLLVLAGALCNDSYIRVEDGKAAVIGDPTENALVELGMRVDLYKDALEQELPRVDEVPFDSARKLMTTVHKHGQGFRVYTKGAPDVLLKACSRILVEGEPRELTAELRDAVDQANSQMAEAALRVLGMAYKELPPDTDLKQVKDELETDLIFIGLCGMIDPPRPEAREAVKLCRKAGIKPVMITGDHAATAMAIARDLGILAEGDTVLTGRELDQMDDEELKEVVRSCSVYARVSPEHKVRIVKAWQSWQDIVAMTGDGVNDAPALKRADIGAAMGIVGTEVAKEASDMVLTDDNFATIVAAVEEGRVIFSNIIKSIQFLLSCNVGEILV